MTASYATYEDYVALYGEPSMPQSQINARLEQQSAKLRGLCSLTGEEELTEDQDELAKGLVCDAVCKAASSCKVPGTDIASDGVSRSSFSANGFQLDTTFANPSGSSWFDRSMLAAFKKTLGRSQVIGWI